ncbi:glycosyltransferase family 4 protein [Mariprofundus sp. NF]|uniref:glycosyltransferase family 4 protein n=1 Tax=Mariprofundus sp. NF TaxID=2608716 RepID=UPI0015A416CB|nr:glycosyltransferase family 1 protein [Mariprofundus sp. NF]NWF37942.1 glycosyltransferase family 4 protein [Mariprofundus sp. NF]
MKVVFDDQVFCWQAFGGISRYFYELTRRIGNDPDFSASVVAPMHVNSYLSEGDVDVKGIRIPKFKHSGRIISALNSIVEPMMIRAEKPDVLHETHYYRRRSLAPSGCPTVLTVFDMIHEKFPEHFLARDRTSETKREAVERADRIICISASTQRDLIDLFNVPLEKTVVVHLGFSLTNSGEILSSQGEQHPFILYVGPRGGYKNFDTLLQAFAASSELKNNFSVVAFGGGGFSSEEVDRIRALGLTDSIRQLSGDDALLSGLYRKAEAFVYPSLYEGFGIPPLEAMSFDCPVICSNTSSIPEVVGDAARLFDPDDVDELRTSIEEVVSSSELSDELIQRGRERIRCFSWDRTASESMDVYRELLQ